MAVDYYQDLTTQERLDRIAQIINKGIYLYHQRTDSKMDEPSTEEKDKAHITKVRYNDSKITELRVDLDNKILTTKEVMDFLKVSRTTLWRLRKQGKLIFYLIGRVAVRYALLDIMNYLESNKW